MERVLTRFQLEFQRGFRVGRAVGMFLGGLSAREVGRQCGMDHKTVSKWVQRFRLRQARFGVTTGRPKLASERSHRYLMRLADRHHLATVTELLNLWRERVSRFTAYRMLKARGLRFCRKFKKPFISDLNAQRRLRWAMRKSIRREDYWNRLVFSDETMIRRISDRSRGVWRRRGTGLNRDLVNATVRGGGGGLLLWGAVWHGGRSRLQILRQRVTGASYIRTLQVCN